MGMLCLSGKWDNTLMWSHYADDHRGFMIEFSGEDPFFNFGFGKVVYSAERPLLLNRPDRWNDASLFHTKVQIGRTRKNIERLITSAKRASCRGKFVEFPPLEQIDQQNWPIHLRDVPPSAIKRSFLDIALQRKQSRGSEVH